MTVQFGNANAFQINPNFAAMAEDLEILSTTDKAARYRSLVPQINALVGGETDVTANLANIMAALKFGMGFFWVGCYLAKGDELVLGPFQGPVACTRITKGRGVCGTSWANNEVLIVPDVDAFPGHIACSSESKSEIVLPACNKSGEVALILDVDSTVFNDFDETDREYLQQVIQIIERFL